MSVIRARAWLLATGGTLLVACGGRTAPPSYDGFIDAGGEAPPAVECSRVQDCDGFDDRCAPKTCSPDGKCMALPKVDCDDGDPCTIDSCASTTGACTHVPATFDLDGDGHRAPLPGHKPGDPGSCGDDCNDADPTIHPGAKEICGVDNNCDGIIEPFHYVLPVGGVDAIQISSDMPPAEPSGLAWNGASYLTGYTGSPSGKFHVFTSQLAPDGKVVVPEAQFTKVTADSTGGDVVWTGAEFGVMWDDRRDDWETYFNRVNAKGEKVGPDTPVSDVDGVWSLGTSLVWTGSEYVLAFQDQRDLNPDFTLYAQRVDVDGKLVGKNVKLDDQQGEEPVIAVGTSTLGLAWTHTEGTRHDLFFRVLDRNLSPLTPSQKLTIGSVRGTYPSIAWTGSNYAVAWHDPDASPHAIYGALLDEKGTLIVGPKKLTDSPKYSRYPNLRPLGDRLLLVWSDTKDGNKGYELYSKQLDLKLTPIDAEMRITNAIGDSVFPTVASGPTGEVSMLFRDDRKGEDLVYFTRLVCQPEAPH